MDIFLETRIWAVDPDYPDPRVIALAAERLRQGALVAFPTETVYGLGANALDALAVARIFQAKQRPASDPLIVHIYDISWLEKVAREIPDQAWMLAQQFWPGPLTLILKRHMRIPAIVSAGLDTVAVRVPGHPVALALLAQATVPIAAPSANLFARTSPTSAQHVLEDLAGRIDLVLDAGSTSIGLESTVLDLTVSPPMMLRPGGISLEALQQVRSDVAYCPRHIAADSIVEASASPGMLSRHYAPAARLLLFTGPSDSVLNSMYATAQRLIADQQTVGILLPEEEQAMFADMSVELVSLGSYTDLAQIGHNLFASMRELDRRGVDAMLTHGFVQQGVGLAIWDRLFRAADGHVIEVTTATS